MEDKLIYCEPGKKYISLVTGDVITARVETNLISYGNKTEMSMNGKAKGKFFPEALITIYPAGKWLTNQNLKSKNLKTL